MKSKKKTNRPDSVAVIGNYLPRKCGIATFTTDLTNAIAEEIGDDDAVWSIAMDDLDGGYHYPRRVKFQIRDNRLSDYLRGADFLNVHRPNVAILQHEFGIYGGHSGGHILMLIKNLNMPVIVTLHTVLERPSEEQKTIMMDIARYADALVVLSRKGEEILRDVYNIPKSSIFFIHHGIPDVGFEDPCFHKETFGVEDRKVLLSFGLLHPGKGLEYVINAMPKILKRHPDLIYIILGATHPNVIKKTGDAYRQNLHQLVDRLDLKNYVQFKNKFVELDELCQYIGAADIYITPYLSEEQIASGTLAYTIGAGKAVISTPYWYAAEMLAEGRGVLVKFRDSNEIADAVNNLLDDDNRRNSIRKRTYQFGRLMIWKEVAREYISLATEIVDRVGSKPKAQYTEAPIPGSVDGLPEAKLDHLIAMTDGVGILQHANYSIPDRNHGYCVDDNARALIAATMYYSLYKDESVISLIQTYLAFLYHAFNRKNSMFRNFMSYDRQWLENSGSEDSHGRSLWGLGVTVKYSPDEAIRHMAAKLFIDGLNRVEEFVFPRAWAFILVGIHSYLEIYSGDARVRNLRKVLANKLFEKFKNNSDAKWPWPEETVTYANAKLPHSLILSGQWIPDAMMFDQGIKSLKWLVGVQTSPEGHFSAIGNEQWLKKNGESSKFDQQPIEAMGVVEACAEAFRSTGDSMWLRQARMAMNWFLGRNDINVPLYDFKTGGCCDGLQSHGVNANQGAESTLAGLISLLTVQEVSGQSAFIDGGRVTK